VNQLIMTKRHINGVAILDLSGDICMGPGNIFLQQTLRSLAEQNEMRVLINLANVAYIDSSGLGELVAGYTVMKKNGGELKLLNLTARVTELMMITKLLTVFDVFDNEPDAISAFTFDNDGVATGPLDANFVSLDVAA
jgi:anti-sigma B factor antagonist